MNQWYELVLTILGCIGAIFGYLAAKHSKAANHAVNHQGAGAPKIYDLVTRIDTRVDLINDWMIRHKTEAASRDEQLDEIGRRLETKIAEFGCPIRLGYTLRPLCGSEVTDVICEVAESKIKTEADRVAIELRTTAENAARILAAKKDSDK
jgi:hypothetical protein